MAPTKKEEKEERWCGVGRNCFVISSFENMHTYDVARSLAMYTDSKSTVVQYCSNEKEFLKFALFHYTVCFRPVSQLLCDEKLKKSQNLKKMKCQLLLFFAYIIL